MPISQKQFNNLVLLLSRAWVYHQAEQTKALRDAYLMIAGDRLRALKDPWERLGDPGARFENIFGIMDSQKETEFLSLILEGRTSVAVSTRIIYNVGVSGCASAFFATVQGNGRQWDKKHSGDIFRAQTSVIARMLNNHLGTNYNYTVDRPSKHSMISHILDVYGPTLFVGAALLFVGALAVATAPASLSALSISMGFLGTIAEMVGAFLIVADCMDIGLKLSSLSHAKHQNPEPEAIYHPAN